MITSTPLTLVVIPTVYEIIDEWREWLLARPRRHTSIHAGEGAETVPGD